MRYSVALLAAVATLFAGTAHAGWIHESPATANDQGAYASIALDASDMSYAAWYDVTNARVRYGKRPLSGWQISSLDTAGKGEFASLKIMPLSFWPAIAYYDAAGEARYASFGPSIWQYQWVNAVAGGDEGRWTDLAFDSSGTPWLSYHFDEGASGDLGLLVCNKAGPTWDCTEVETRPSATAAAGELLGTHTAIVIDSAENPWVTYRDELDGRQKIAWRDAGTWQVEYVSADGDSAGSYPGIAIDDNDFIYISHWDDGEAGGNCASVVSNETGDWVKDSFDCFASDDYGKYTGIALGADGSLHVSYYGDPGLRYARKAPAGTWETQTPDNTGDPGLWTSIALAAKDAPHIVHYEAGAGDFRYTWWLGDPVIDSIDPHPRKTPTIRSASPSPGRRLPRTRPSASTTRTATSPCPRRPRRFFSARNIGFDVDLVGAWPGLYDVVVTNTESSGVLEEGFLVTSPPPDITATDPFGGPNDALLYNVDIEGNYFADGMTVKLIPRRVRRSTRIR
ncbi:MAG: hypothetical protein M5R36_02595 [Deltaproteobacteria bacterium]|nr:hypothetical protein [Deltaproteobacteria bacterium]